MKRITTRLTMSPELEKLLAFSYSPTAFGKPMKRKVVQLGKKYYWDEVVDNDEMLDYWRNYWRIPIEYNSLLVNIYEKGQSIAPHTDKINNLVPTSKVYSCSMSISEDEQLTKKLGTMKFSTGEKLDLLHRTVVVFDPIEHYRKKIKHSATSITDRINFTFRQLE